MKKKVFILDDDPGIQEIFQLIFEKAGYDTTLYSNGGELLKNLSELPDLFILDKQLSGMDGLDICRQLKEDVKSSNIPVIIVSATPGIGELANDAGADDFIEKPFSKDKLLEKAADCIIINPRPYIVAI